MTCRDCKLWDIESAKDKAGRIRKANAVRCLWVSKEQWPESVIGWNTRPKPTYMTAEMGHGCKCFQKRDKP